MKETKSNHQETLLLNTCFVFGGVIVYILFLLFFSFYQQLATNTHTNIFLQLFENIFFHKHHINAYLSLMIIVLLGCFFAHMFWLAMNKFNFIKKIIYPISLNVSILVNKIANIFSNYAQTKNIKTSKILGIAYLFVFVIACVVVVFTHCLEIKEINFLMLIVMPLTTVSLIYGVGYLTSNYTQSLDSIFPQNRTDKKKLSLEVLKFFGITIGGMLLILTPMFSKMILFFFPFI